MRLVKIYHITLTVCAPNFVNLNSNTFSVKNAIILFSFMFTAREQKKSSPVIKSAVLTF